MAYRSKYDTMQWAKQVYKTMGDDKFTFQLLPGHLRNRGMVIRASCLGLLTKVRAACNGRSTVWKVNTKKLGVL